MRPRSFERGKSPRIKRLVRHSPGFNEAALFRTRKGVRSRAQWQGGSQRFNEAALFRTRKGSLPQPKQQRSPQRFNEAALFRTRKGHVAPNLLAGHACASMRPRSFERGKVVINPLIITISIRFNEAALFRTRKGRAGSLEESSQDSFNEAALFRTRKESGMITTVAGTSGFNEAALFRTRKGRDELRFFKCA